MPTIPFVGPTYQARSLTLDAQRCINLYLEQDQGQGGKTPAALYQTPGLLERYDVLSPGGIRGLYTTRRDARVFAVADNRLIELLSDFTTTTHGTLNTLSGPVSMSDNATQLKITDGADGYIFTLATDTLAQITDGDYLGGGPCTTLDSYFIVVVPASEQLQISALNDGTAYAAADVSSADAQPDLLVTVVSDERQLWLFGQTSGEIWYNSGNVDFPFEPIQGANFDIGTINPWVVQSVEGTLVWLGRTDRGQGQVYATQGYVPQRISTHAIELMIAGWADLTEARSYTYQQEGHTFYILWHPDGPALGFDFATGMWHERSSLDTASGLQDTHRVCCHTYGHGENLVGDYANGKIYAMRLDTYTDNGVAMLCARSAQYVNTERKRLKHTRFELDADRGVGLDGSPTVGDDPQWELRWSDDNARTWSTLQPQSMGQQGAYMARARWHRLGAPFERIYWVQSTAPVKRSIVRAFLNG